MSVRSVWPAYQAGPRLSAFVVGSPATLRGR
jgi:hypothetical protein